jgi:isoquinoline 1-oxidoreductase alpha subunit
MPALRINGKDRTVDADTNMPLLWVIRDIVGLTGTKYGCGIGECGACTVHVNGRAVRSCRMTLGEASGHDITTIEGLGDNSQIQKAWAQQNVAECGFCQPGQIMQAAAMLKQNPTPEAEEILRAMSGNICRCGTYQRILAAIRAVTGDAH